MKGDVVGVGVVALRRTCMAMYWSRIRPMTRERRAERVRRRRVAEAARCGCVTGEGRQGDCGEGDAMAGVGLFVCGHGVG